MAVLLRHVRRNEFLAQPTVTTVRTEAAAREDEPVVAANNPRRPVGAKRAESFDAGAFEGTFGLVRARNRSPPPVAPIRHRNRPALVAPGGSADAALQQLDSRFLHHRHDAVRRTLTFERPFSRALYARA